MRMEHGYQITHNAADFVNGDTITRFRAQLDAWMKPQGDKGDKGDNTEREAKEHQRICRHQAGRAEKSKPQMRMHGKSTRSEHKAHPPAGARKIGTRGIRRSSRVLASWLILCGPCLAAPTPPVFHAQGELRKGCRRGPAQARPGDSPFSPCGA